jgi:hypothetical protein
MEAAGQLLTLVRAEHMAVHNFFISCQRRLPEGRKEGRVSEKKISMHAHLEESVGCFQMIAQCW